MLINWQTRELNLKVVYYGAALSGKTTNLEQIHARIDPKKRGELVSLKTHEDRTLFFDFMQLELGKIGGLIPRIQLYTVPGQIYYEASRRIVMRGADGIVFVVDSSANRLDDNLESWASMKMNLAALNLPMKNLPIVVQLNKRDLPNAIPVATLKSVLPIGVYPSFEAVAVQSKGVFDTLKAIVNNVLSSVQKEMA
ncbi:MAG: ADP-ribosylation factor-like protein [Anaerolineae bacterium]